MPEMEIDQQLAVQTDNAGTQGQPVPTDDPERAKEREKLRAFNSAGSEKKVNGEVPNIGADDKQDKAKPEPVKQENGQESVKPSNPKIGLPRGVQRRIDKYHSENQILKERLERLEASQAQKPQGKEQPKLTRANFVNEDEYIEYLVEQKSEEKIRKVQEESAKRNLQDMQDNESQRQTLEKIARKKQEDFSDSPEALREFEQIVTTIDDSDVPEDMHELAMSLPYGLRAFSMLLKPDHANVLAWFATLPPSIRAVEFRDFAVALRQKLSAPKELKRESTNAPDPIGMVGAGGLSKNNSLMSNNERLRAREKERERLGR